MLNDDNGAAATRQQQILPEHQSTAITNRTGTEMRQVAWGSKLAQLSANREKSFCVMASSVSSLAVSKPSRITPMNRFKKTNVMMNVKLVMGVKGTRRGRREAGGEGR